MAALGENENEGDHLPHDLKTHGLSSVVLVNVFEDHTPGQVFLALVVLAACTFLAADRKDAAASVAVGCEALGDLQISSFSLNWIVLRLDDKEFPHFYF